MKKIYWLSRHDLSPAQQQAISDFHGEVEVVKEAAVFNSEAGLAEIIQARRDGFCYAVAGAVHYLKAAEYGLGFGIFENHPAKRQDGSFGLKAVYHIEPYCTVPCGGHEHGQPSFVVRKVWDNPDPLSDKGEALIPVAR